MELQKIKCTSCGKTLLEAYSGEIIKHCPRCGADVHVVVASKGVIDLNRDTIKVTEQKYCLGLFV